MQFNKYRNLANIEKYNWVGKDRLLKSNTKRINNNSKVILFVFDFAINKPVTLNSLRSVLAFQRSRILI